MFLQIAEQETKKEQIFIGENAITKLKDLGLTYEDIRITVVAAIKEYNELSKYAYSMEKNTKFFYSAIRYFRHRMSAKGWLVDDKYNLNRTLPPNQKRAFVFSSGDKNVCNETITPMTKNKKGEVSLTAVEMNNVIQLSFYQDLFPDEIIKPEKYDIQEIQHWFILFHKVKQQVWVEISLPESIDRKTNKICKWSERIILPLIEYKPGLIDENSVITNNIKATLCYNKEDELNITRK